MRCPHGTHRLGLDGASCRRCGGEVRLYLAFRDTAVVLYNEARRLWEASELERAGTCLEVALRMWADLPEAHWLLAAIEVRRGRVESARHHLTRAQSLGAAVDPAWVDQALPP